MVRNDEEHVLNFHYCHSMNGDVRSHFAESWFKAINYPQDSYKMIWYNYDIPIPIILIKWNPAKIACKENKHILIEPEYDWRNTLLDSQQWTRTEKLDKIRMRAWKTSFLSFGLLSCVVPLFMWELSFVSAPGLGVPIHGKKTRGNQHALHG